MESVGQIIDQYSSLDPLEAYYRKNHIKYRIKTDFSCPASDIIVSALAPEFYVLDVGCGDGHTLISNSGRFASGVGIDESEYAVELAKATSVKKGCANVEFIKAQAISLPFVDAEFDLIFTERGPLGHGDSTLVEAVRVLKPNGLILIETMGSHNVIEYLRAGGLTHEGTLLTSLEIERDRFQRFGLEILVLLSNVYTLRFETLYDWFEEHCSVQRYLELPLSWPSDEEFITTVVKNSMDSDGHINITHHQLVIGGRKQSCAFGSRSL